MKNISAVAVISAVLCLSCITASAQEKDWANFGRYEKANSEVCVRPKAVFMGDSITQGWGRSDDDFFSGNNFLCRGISGQTTSQMLVRFRRDVIGLSPKYVVILAGINDVALNNGYISNENILGNIISMCELARLHKIRPILCSVTPADRFSWRKGMQPADTIRELNRLIQEYAESAKIPYVDYYSVLTTETGGMPEKYASDGVHPNLECYKVMESIVLPYIK